jgi:cell wall-associated NlpC family hydrolase
MRALLMVVLAAATTACAAPLATPGPTPQPFPRPSTEPPQGESSAEPRRTPGEGGAEPRRSLGEGGAESRRSLGEGGAESRRSLGEGGAGGYEISGTALTLRGTPYRDGGTDPNGFDCSGFVWYVFGSHGIAAPRTVSEQARWGEQVDAADLRPGDLVFFTTTAPGPTHVGIVIGGDSFVHAPSSSGVVRVERLSTSYWSSRFVAARRVV